MRLVLDTNIYVNNLIPEEGNPAKIVRWWLEGEFDLLLSQPIIDEILRVTSYERIQKKYSYEGVRVLTPAAFVGLKKAGQA